MSSSITQFFTDRSVLITGASGFLGKVLLEKLLRECPGLENVFVLLRPKFGQTSNQRLADLLQSEA